MAVGGGTAAGALAAAEALAGTASHLISFGLAGGLDPALRPGDLIVPSRVMHLSQTWETEPALNAALGGSTAHVLLGGGTVLATTASKAAAFTAGAHAVDLESAAVARVADSRGLPFAVLRAVCDPASRDLPMAALVALDAAGRIAVLQVAIAMLRRPWEMPDLIALGRDAAVARRALIGRVLETRLM